MDLSIIPIKELVALRDTISNMISSYDDGYLYICKVRSYGRSWTENLSRMYMRWKSCVFNMMVKMVL
jgi:hypothetical protein